MVRGGSRPGPLVEVRPPPSHGARAKTHWRRERAIRNPAVDGRAPQPGHLEHGGQACEYARSIVSGG